MPIVSRHPGKLGRVLEKIEAQDNKAFGTTNVLDIAHRVGFKIDNRNYIFKKTQRGERE